MKKITVKMTKGNSTIFAEISQHDREGHFTEDEHAATGYYVNGACGSMSDYSLSQRDIAFQSFYTKIGSKVSDGYVAERV